jgi:GT2 family glycosyltransferase
MKAVKIDKYCLNSLNVGVARAWNMGAELSEGKYLCFINDDVRIGKRSVETLVMHLDENSNVAQVGPKGSNWRNGEHFEFVETDGPELADVISGFMFMVRADIYWSVGGFDVSYTPAGYEEIDFSFNIRKFGFQNVVIPGLNINHNEHHGVSSFSTNIKFFNQQISTIELHERNREYFLGKWKDFKTSANN